MATQASFGKAHDFIDADYVTVTPDGRDQPAFRDDPAAFSARSDMEILRSRTFVQAGASRPAGPLFWAGGFLLAGIAFWMAGGHALVERTGVFAASSPTHLRITGWDTKVDGSGRIPTILVDGQVVNEGPARETVPSLQIEVASPNGATTRYKLGTGDVTLESAGTFPFSGRLHLPKDGIETVSISFVQ